MSSCLRSATHVPIEYGGSFANRIRLCVEVVDAVRQVWPDGRPLFVRISATDWTGGGWDIEQSVDLARTLRARGVDLIDCSSGGNVAAATIPVQPGYQVPFAERIRREAGVATGAVGLITSARQADEIVASGQADCVLLARELLRDPYWPLRAAAELEQTVPWPKQYLRAAPPAARPASRSLAKSLQRRRQSRIGRPERPVRTKDQVTRECARCSSKTTRRLRISSRADCARRASRSTAPPTATRGSTPPSRSRTMSPIVDVMLPKRDGLSVIDELRRRGVTTPVLILSARRSVDDRVRGLQAGGDDYLTKPFAFAELLARVQALVRRASRTPEPTTLTVDDLVARSAVAARDARRDSRSICARASSRCSNT